MLSRCRLRCFQLSAAATVVIGGRIASWCLQPVSPLDCRQSGLIYVMTPPSFDAAPGHWIPADQPKTSLNCSRADTVRCAHLLLETSECNRRIFCRPRLSIWIMNGFVNLNVKHLVTFNRTVQNSSVSTQHSFHKKIMHFYGYILIASYLLYSLPDPF